MSIDVFVDWSAMSSDFDVTAAIARLDSPECLGAIASRTSCTVRADAAVQGTRHEWSVRTNYAVEGCRDAIAAAGDDGRALLVLLGDIQPTAEAVALLVGAIDADPMIGFASPRLTGSDENSLATLDVGGDRGIDELPRRLLAEMPETYLVADAPTRCLLIKPLVLANFGELDTRFRTLAGALWHYMAAARRCGFRTVVSNRAVVSASCAERPCPPCAIGLPSLPEPDRVLLRELSPDIERTNSEFGAGCAAATETRLARAMPQAYGARPSLLLDARNIGVGMNGTTVATLGICSGLYAVEREWDITLLASRAACAAHALQQAYPGWQVTTTVPNRQLTVALRLSQPWHIQEMIDLHAAAAYNAYLFLDTISWDIAYPAPRQLGGTWQFMADHADALLFISEYSRDRFRHRFRSATSVPEFVSYLSFDPDDYRLPDVGQPRERDSFIFVVGNEYDHKDVLPTVELLAAAFPYESIVALGPTKAATPRVRVLESGTVSDRHIHRLYAEARIVVFPSFYEGFGFPVVTTLGYGGTVIARQSALLDEIAARCPPHGRLVPFTRRDDLVELVGRILHEQDVPSVPLGTALGNGRPMSWQDVGGRILTFLSQLSGDLSRSHWREREHSISQLLAAPAALSDKGLSRPGVHA
jgi:hypothetical protein